MSHRRLAAVGLALTAAALGALALIVAEPPSASQIQQAPAATPRAATPEPTATPPPTALGPSAAALRRAGRRRLQRAIEWHHSIAEGTATAGRW